MPEIIGRRKFLGAAGRIGAGAVLGSLPLLDGCKGGPTTPDEPDEPAVPVDLDFTVYNHTQGPRGTFRRTGVMSGTTVAISVNELRSQLAITDVYEGTIVIRETLLGTRVGIGRGSGMASFLAPRDDRSYDVFLFNDAGSQFYGVFENYRWVNNVKLKFGTHPRAYRKDFDGLTGEERVWGGEYVPEIGEFGIIDQFNKALKPEWATSPYGSIERIPAPNDERGDFGYGFGNCFGRDSTSAIPSDVYPIYWDGINPTIIPETKSQIERGLGRLSDTLTGFVLGDQLGRETYQVIQENGVLNQAFKDFISYQFLIL